MDKAQTELHQLLQREVTRKEFLQTIGIGLASVLGLSAILKLVGYKTHHSSRGYGSSPYGR